MVCSLEAATFVELKHVSVSYLVNVMHATLQQLQCRCLFGLAILPSVTKLRRSYFANKMESITLLVICQSRLFLRGNDGVRRCSSNFVDIREQVGGEAVEGHREHLLQYAYSRKRLHHPSPHDLMPDMYVVHSIYDVFTADTASEVRPQVSAQRHNRRQKTYVVKPRRCIYVRSFSTPPIQEQTVSILIERK